MSNINLTTEKLNNETSSLILYNDIKKAKDSISDNYMTKSYAYGISIGLKEDNIQLNQLVIKLYTNNLELAKQDYGNNITYNNILIEFEYIEIQGFNIF